MAFPRPHSPRPYPALSRHLRAAPQPSSRRRRHFGARPVTSSQPPVTSQSQPRDVIDNAPSAPAGARESRETAVGGAGPGRGVAQQTWRRREAGAARGGGGECCLSSPSLFFSALPSLSLSFSLPPSPSGASCAVREPGGGGGGQPLGRAALPRRQRGRVGGEAPKLLL